MLPLVEHTDLGVPVVPVSAAVPVVVRAVELMVARVVVRGGEPELENEEGGTSWGHPGEGCYVHRSNKL